MCYYHLWCHLVDTLLSFITVLLQYVKFLFLTNKSGELLKPTTIWLRWRFFGCFFEFILFHIIAVVVVVVVVILVLVLRLVDLGNYMHSIQFKWCKPMYYVGKTFLGHKSTKHLHLPRLKFEISEFKFRIWTRLGSILKMSVQIKFQFKWKSVQFTKFSIFQIWNGSSSNLNLYLKV